MARYDLSGKAALVTGGARGIGFETARALIARGASVAIVDLREEDAQRAAADLHDAHALGIGADVTDRGAMQQAVAATVQRFGGLDVVVANAGIASRAATVQVMPSESFERVLDVNLNGVYRTVAAALPQVVARGGHVVLVASILAFSNGLGAAPYAMAKAGVEQLGRALRVELAPHGASASVAYFGFIDTDLVHEHIDADPLADRLLGTFPKPLVKRLQPKVAGEAIATAIEGRKPRIIRPRRWTLLSTFRGQLNPLIDKRLERDADVRDIVGELEARATEVRASGPSSAR
jgi:NAD(P)-dependent dehydrogenase (short-subunit alcohol dehydrogenase family)